MFTSGPRLNDGIDGDPRRQAVAALRGYAYQIYASALAWIDLSANEQLLLEVAEDYAVATQDALEAVQVRDTAASTTLTLRSAAIAQTIESFVDLSRRNPEKRLTIRYLTTSSVSPERALNDRPAGVAGLAYWRQAAAGADVAPLRAVLTRLDLNAAAIDFIAERDDDALRADLLRQIHWDGGAADIAGVRRELEAAIFALGQRDVGGFTSTEVQTITASIIDAVLDAIISGGSRSLNRLDLVALLERTSHVSVPRRDLEAILLAAKGETPFAPAALWWREEETPLPPLLAPRRGAAEALSNSVRKAGLAFAFGATGMGKTLLARLAARRIGGDWMIADFAGLDAGQSTARLDSLIGALAMTPCAGVILDDLNTTTAPDVAKRLVRFRASLARRDRLGVVTSYRAPDARLRSELGISKNDAQEVLDLTEAEVSALISDAGGDPVRWARAIFLATAAGHPQLTQATIADLQWRSWPVDELERLYSLDWSGLDLAAQRATARRRLIETAPEGARILLNRLSLLIGSFRRPVALELAELTPEILSAGEHLDALTGPWIDVVGDDRLRVSPLLSDAGSSGLSKAAQHKVHAAAADVLLRGTDYNVQDASAGLMHALIARSPEPLQRLALAIIGSDHETLPRLASWFGPLQALRADQHIFPENLVISRLLRLAQVLLITASEDASGLTEKWNALKAEIAEEQDKEARERFELMVLAKVLMQRRMAETPDWVAQLVRFEKLIRDFPLKVPPTSDGRSIDPIGLYFMSLSMALNSVAALSDCFTQLDVLKPADRDIVLAHLRTHPEEITHTINHPWVAERTDGEIEGRPRAAIYAQLARRAADWGYPEISAWCHTARSIMLDEYADDEVAALAALDEAEAVLGPHLVISRARAKVAYRRRRHGDALTLLRDVMQGGLKQDAVGTMYLCREAAISATEVDNKAEALDWFGQALTAARAVKSDAWGATVVGLQADVALAKFRCGDTQAAIFELWGALEAARAIDPAGSLKATYLHKVLGHACLWVNAHITQAAYPMELVAPPGMCSNPDPSEEIRTLPPASLEGSHYILAAADAYSGGSLGFDQTLDTLLAGRHIFTLESQRRLGRLERAVRTLDFKALRPSIKDGLEAMCLGVQRMLAKSEPDDVLPLEAGPFPRLPEADRLGENAVRFVNDVLFATELLADLRGTPQATDELAAIAADLVQDGYAAPTYLEDPTASQHAFREIWRRSRASSPLLAEDLFMAGMRIMEWSNKSVFARSVLPDLGRWASNAWSAILTEQRFRLRHPAVTVPAIEAAIRVAISDADRLPAILSAARFAFNFNLSDDMIALLRLSQAVGRVSPK